ncbi:response regulator transcription factor [Hylemonella sp. W303a]|uniref:response regulator transcription factor n=1 Tax=Hylemonella sp. W303a TaxID=3389873 RepID=UPI00396B15A5
MDTLAAMSPTPLLMIEDDARLAAMVRDYLAPSGFAVQHAGTGAAGLAKLGASPQSPETAPQLIVLDLMLPDMDGLDICRRIRSLPGTTAHTPILMLTAKGDPMDRVIGLEIGADDYLAKPFEPRELLARVRALLRRHAQSTTSLNTDEGTSSGHPPLHFGSLTIDRDARTVTVQGRPCELTSYQFDLLVTLAERAGRVLTREQIMEAVRGRELEAFDRSIDVHMGRIRAAIEADPKTPKRILTVRGVGYVFARQQD